MHKTRLTQNTKATHTSNAKSKKEGEREQRMMQNHLEPFSFHTLEEPFPFSKPLIQR